MINNDLDLQQIIHDRLHITLADIEAYCRRWHIVEFALFGSVLRDDFRPDSDVDVLVTYEQNYRLSLSALLDMNEELEKAVGRSVDIVEKRLIKNPYRRANILKTHRVVYVTHSQFEF